MLKKLLAFLLTLCLALALAAGVAAEEPTSGSCGDNACWSFSGDTLTITGTGAVQDYGICDGEQSQYLGRPWDVYRQQIRRVVIGEGITRLGNESFHSLIELQTLELPSTLTEIGSFTFGICSALQTVQLPQKLTSIGNNAFWFCTNLKTVEIPASVTFVGNNVFEECHALTDVSFHSDPNLPSFAMGSSVFRGCSLLEEIRVEDGHIALKSIDGALYSCGSSGERVLIVYPAGLKNTDLRIADNTVCIEQSAFYFNFSLRNVIIPDTVTKIGDSAFMYTLVSIVKFLGSAPEIQANAFYDCNVTFRYNAADPSWDIRESLDPEYLVGPQGSITWESYSTGPAEGVCGDNAVWHYADGTLTISGTGSTYDYRETAVEDNVRYSRPWDVLRDNLYHVVIEEGITRLGMDLFFQMPYLQSVELPDTLTNIGRFAFCWCPSLSSAELPESLTYLGQQSFAGTALTAVEIPASVNFLDCAYDDCKFLTDVYIRSDPNKKGFTAAHSIFRNCVSLEEIRVEDGHAALRSIDGVLYFRWPSGPMCLLDYPAGRKSTEYRIADNTFGIGQSALSDNLYLRHVTIPDTVGKIYDGAFSQCFNLQTVKFEGSAPEILPGAFWGTNITIYYPANDPSWDARDQWSGDALVGWQGSKNWVAYNPENPFLDVPMGAFYEEPVLWALENGITSGASANSFNPNGACLRAQVVTFLWRAAGCPEPETFHNPFADVSESDFYYKAVLWAVEQGITNGADATHFNPMGVCNRAQVVTFLYRAFGNPPVENAENPFADVDGGTWYAAPVLWAVEQGITNGLSAESFGPNADCNRAQIVTFLYRAYN